jgi:hypothetical protein
MVPVAPPELAAEAAVLAADRAEALAQLEAALATLGEAEPGTRGTAPEAAAAPEELRQAAREVLAAESEVELAEQALARMPSGGAEALRAAEAAVADGEAARSAVPAARRRALGALISGTGMAIVIAALAWHPGWYVVPVALVAVLVADLRATASASRSASVRAVRLLAEAGMAGTEGLERALGRQREREQAMQRLEGARHRRDAARSRWEELAPGIEPAGVESLIGRLAGESAGTSAQEPALPDAVRILARGLVEDARRRIARTEAALDEMARRFGLGPLRPAEVAARLQAACESAQVTVSAPPPKRGSH